MTSFAFRLNHYRGARRIFNAGFVLAFFGLTQCACLAATSNGMAATPGPTPSPSPTLAQIDTLSTRLTVGTSESILINEFVIMGSSPKKVCLRGLGPSLADIGIEGALADPVLSLYDSEGTLIANNDNWKDTQEEEIRALALQPPDDLESAIVATLSPGTYATALSGKGGTTGVALGEVYDLEVDNSTLAAVGSRGPSLFGSEVMIAGFILSGQQPIEVLVRVLGPSLGSVGVMEPAPDPSLRIYNVNGILLASNDNWQDTQQAEIEATGLAPEDPLESALVVTLPPEPYTVITMGEPGIVFAQVYALPYDGSPLNPDPVPIPTPPPTPTPSPTPTPTPTPSPSPAAKSLNISTRSNVQAGDGVMIGGFIINGTTSKSVLLRGIGPSLQSLPQPDLLADPVLELHGSDGELIATNDNWQDNSDQATQIEATGLAPQNDLEAAILATLSPGLYTAIVSGGGGRAGIGLVEAYDLDEAGDSQLANISTRAFVQTGDSVEIGGFILAGENNSPQIIIRALGPSLAAQGIANPLTDPVLELRDANGLPIAFDDNWQDNPAQAAEITGAGLAPDEDAEAALIMTLPPGAYTAIVSGRDGGTGIALVEIYNLQ